MIKFYLSGVESEYALIDKMFSKGYPSFGVIISFYKLQSANYLMESLKRWQINYKVRAYITPGFDYSTKKSQRSKILSEIVNESKDDEYFDQYIDWLVSHSDYYENAFEYRRNGLALEKLAGYRQMYLDAGIASHIIIQFTRDEGIPFVKEMIAKGFKWFTFINSSEKAEDAEEMAREVVEAGGQVHLSEFTKHDLLSIKESVDSVDSTVWSSASRWGKVFFMKFGKIKIYNIDDADVLNAAVQDRFWNIFSDQVRQSVLAKKNVHPLNAWNAYQLMLYIEHLNANIPAYKDYLRNGGSIPEFAEGKDSMGRDKIKEIAKFKSPTNAIFSRKLLEFGLQCNTCIIRDKCPAYKKDSVCAYTEVWKETGALNTRNVEAVISSLESLVEEQNQRLIRSQFIESTQGGNINKNVTDLQNSLIRNLDILYKLKFGSINQNKYNILNIGSNQMVVGASEDVLNAVRSEFGEDIANKINKRLSEDSNSDATNEDGDDTIDGGSSE